MLEEVESHPYLGVVLDNKMRWSPHIGVITSRANNVLRLFKRNLWNRSKWVKETAYTTLVRPKLHNYHARWQAPTEYHFLQLCPRFLLQFCKSLQPEPLNTTSRSSFQRSHLAKGFFKKVLADSQIASLSTRAYPPSVILSQWAILLLSCSSLGTSHIFLRILVTPYNNNKDV